MSSVETTYTPYPSVLIKLIEGSVVVLERGGTYTEGCTEGEGMAVLPSLGHQMLTHNLILYIIPLG